MGRTAGAASSQVLLRLLFAVSGFSSLLLEVIWARQLTQITGSGVRSTATVAAVMLGGLALGAYLSGLRSDSLKHALRRYALIEACIGCWALLTPLLGSFLGRTLPLLGPLARGQAADWIPPALLAAATMVLPGALLMGATTPLVVRADFSLSGAGSSEGFGGRRLGSLYAWNTLGGAAGALAAAFWILPSLGMRSSCVLAGVLDLALAGTVLIVWRQRGTKHGPGRTAAAATSRDGRGLSFPSLSVLPALALLGAGALAAMAQVAWTRLLVLFFGSSVQALGLTLAACLAGLAVGAGQCSAALRRGRSAARVGIVCSLASAGLLFLTLPCWGKLPVLTSLAQARLGGSFADAVALQALLCCLLIVPSAAAFGALLPALTALMEREDSGTGGVAGTGYAIDSTGSIAGGLGAVFFLLPRWGVENLLRGCLLGSLVLFAVLCQRFKPFGIGSVRLLALCGGLAVGAAFLPAWDPVLLTSGPLLYASAYTRAGGASWKGVEASMRRRGELLFLDEGPDATVTVRRSPSGTRSLQINGKTDASDGGDLPAQVLAGQLPALMVADPARVLLIGLASGTTAASLASHALERIECVEICPGVLRAARLFGEANRDVLSDPRLRLIVGDGRTYLLGSSAAFDLIVSQPTNPWIAGVTNLFTREFFLSARAHLSARGVLAVWVQGYSMDPEDFRSLVATFQEVFPRSQLWEESAGGGDYFLLGGIGPGASLQQIVGRMSGSIRSDLQRAGISDPADLLLRFIAADDALRRFGRGAPRITDDNLRLEYSSPREIWRNRLPDLLSSLERIRQSPAAIFPEIMDPSQQALRDLLAERERGRRERMRAARSLSPRDLEALASPALQAAMDSLRNGNSERAAIFLQQARREVPFAPIVPMLSGWIALGEGRSAEAETAFRAALRLDPRSSEGQEGLGLSLYRQGKLDDAAGSLRKAVEGAPGDPETTANLGAVLLAQGKNEEALRWLDRSIAADARQISARVNRGVALARLGRAEEAIREYQAALAMDPLNEDALFNLRRAEQRLGKVPSSP